ncbi:hypothetical protein [Tenacibaculum caenipelagi]|uniref:Uncharacterized protein n=1 Tax=Tenacibaculum caenipelagi TaxID=1325435 RepID=A0A4R6TI19_9FLAO|nr:hypothetical protein [Tenacibaculum caenipelagi]TDQ28846.1 hypothetical protein DFQ07_1227 [Tenacibaculum caenipelagi]
MKKQVLLLLAVCTISFGYAQKMKVVNGNFDFIKDQKEINVEFVYDNMKLFKKNLTNEEYMAERSAKLEEDSRGKGERWKKSWIGSREIIYAPKFLELMNRYLEKDHGVYFAENLKDAKYTLVVETVWVYPGWNAAVMRQPAKVSTLLKFVETANKDNVVLEITSKNAPGNKFGGTFSNEDRLGEGYAKTGKSLAKLVLKKAFK